MSSSEWEEYLKDYYEQKRLEKYQQTRTLPQPKTTTLTVVLYIALLPIIILGLVAVILLTSSFEAWARVLILIIYALCIVEIYVRLLAIKIVECYQHYATEEKRRNCKCVPSCSEYAILCLKKYELVYALLKIRKRLFVTCKGFDYIVDNP